MKFEEACKLLNIDPSLFVEKESIKEAVQKENEEVLELKKSFQAFQATNKEFIEGFEKRESQYKEKITSLENQLTELAKSFKQVIEEIVPKLQENLKKELEEKDNPFLVDLKKSVNKLTEDIKTIQDSPARPAKSITKGVTYLEKSFNSKSENSKNLQELHLIHDRPIIKSLLGKRLDQELKSGNPRSPIIEVARAYDASSYLSPEQIKILNSDKTIGEEYFFNT